MRAARTHNTAAIGANRSVRCQMSRRPEQQSLFDPTDGGQCPPYRSTGGSTGSTASAAAAVPGPSLAPTCGCTNVQLERTGGGKGAGTTRRVGVERVSPRVLIPLAVVSTFAILFVGWEVAERHLFPTLSVGTRHALLTLRAGVITAVASATVYLLMRRQQHRLADTAERITGLLESYAVRRSSTERFENPNLVHCREVLDCRRRDCVMYDSPDRRCWQVIALRHNVGNRQVPEVTLQQCHECEVYRRSCPDKLTELGESCNNLMFLLEDEARQVGSMRAQFVQKEKMVAVGQLAAGIAHEVCNPLSSISSIVQMLKRARSQGPDTEQLELIETHVQRISSTVRQLVSLSRPSVERWERADIGEILDDVVQLVTFDGRARLVEIAFERPRSLPRTFVLRGQLDQVFINLSLNALDAMPDGGRLRISAREEHGSIVVRVEDSGCGIAPETAPRVFEPFFTTKEPGRGTGLGLAVSYNIVEKHGGSLDFTSTPGEGTAFRVEIPILSKAPSA